MVGPGLGGVWLVHGWVSQKWDKVGTGLVQCWNKVGTRLTQHWVGYDWFKAGTDLAQS